MDAWQVVIRHTMGDIPLGLFETAEEAQEFAHKVGATDGEKEKRLLKSDARTPVSVYLYRFVRGRLDSTYCVKRFE